ncbi:MAG: AAA family ATPase [Nitrospiraceae bacterium]|nr:AAA family ATPase [Nitrospiraceae bacterium]
MRIGLCGSHRTGKTTLAAAISRRAGMPFVQTVTSDVFRQFGLDPAKPLPFEKRLWIQDKVLEAAEAIWRQTSGGFVTDRTPVDMMAYTLADIQGATEADFGRLEAYLDRCFESANRFFDALVVVQPGIKLVHEEGKAALNRAYMEHLNYLVLGLASDRRLKARTICLGHGATGIEERVRTVLEALGL